MTYKNQYVDFNLTLAIECAHSFSSASGLGCTISDTSGKILNSIGYSCEKCQICYLSNRTKEQCIQAHIYGMTEAERFGGKYIYFCPSGLTCFVSPILGKHGSSAKITVGPFLMVDIDDYIAFEIEERLELDKTQKSRLIKELDSIPQIDTKRVNALSTLLFMSVGFMNNVSEASRMLNLQSSDAMQGQIGEYIKQLKYGEALPKYPIEKEQCLLRAISESDKTSAGRYLNELLGHIFFCCGNDFVAIKSRIYELLILISRATIIGGADSERALEVSHRYLLKISNSSDTYELCDWLSSAMNHLIDTTFTFENLRHVDAIHKSLHYMMEHYHKKITLEETAQVVYFSASYFSKIFKEETGNSWSSHLNHIRVEKSKTLLLDNSLKIVDIAFMVGFEDQSYFTKVFKRTTGISPNKYRMTKNKI